MPEENERDSLREAHMRRGSFPSCLGLLPYRRAYRDGAPCLIRP